MVIVEAPFGSFTPFRLKKRERALTCPI
ncbi:Hypothetical protein CpCP13_1533 [Corynebacterium pseudotuberculosis]|nr:Hypothetical protein Cp267_1560 [Corynebacterium pseudotuberculosis 267]AJC14232.1 Hypothetical protein CpVD57_1527 [Corynebacterium pseudotuberculosis]AKJ56178.1 Hypothetical protein Cp12C_1576 [Corynebacterium pseudotuberculosis]ANQ77692.1 Hypothetical protein CpCP13_1533 [Corynebacterium pseudotuberculosis]AQU93226.1 Hypothetical protein CpMIC6_1594 [Corynebacterium pseudotuberculosis]